MSLPMKPQFSHIETEAFNVYAVEFFSKNYVRSVGFGTSSLVVVLIIAFVFLAIVSVILTVSAISRLKILNIFLTVKYTFSQVNTTNRSQRVQVLGTDFPLKFLWGFLWVGWWTLCLGN